MVYFARLQLNQIFDINKHDGIVSVEYAGQRDVELFSPSMTKNDNDVSESHHGNALYGIFELLQFLSKGNLLCFL